MNVAEGLKSEKTAFLGSSALSLPPEAGLWIGTMQFAFLSSAAQRRDCQAWEKLEKTVTAVLARRLDEVSQMERRHRRASVWHEPINA